MNARILKAFDALIRKNTNPAKPLSRLWRFLDTRTLHADTRTLSCTVELPCRVADNVPAPIVAVDAKAELLARGTVHWDGTTLRAGGAALPTVEVNPPADMPSPSGPTTELDAAGLAYVMQARDTEGGRVVLEGVQIDPQAGSLCATDGKLLLSAPSGQSDAPASIMHPALAAAIVAMHKAGCEAMCSMRHSEGMHIVTMHGLDGERVTLRGESIGGVYPSWRNAFLSTPDHTVTLPTKFLLEAIKTHGSKQTTGNSLVLRVEGGRARIHSWQGSKTPVALECACEGELPYVAFCAEYMRRALDGAGDTVELRAQGPGRGILIDEGARPGHRLVMPITLPEHSTAPAEYALWEPELRSKRTTSARKPSKRQLLASLDAGDLAKLRELINQL